MESGNPTCADLVTGQSGEFRLDASDFETTPQTYGDAEFSVFIDFTFDDGTPPEAISFDFSAASPPVMAVFVKGGPGGHLYEYDPPTVADDGLVAPPGPQGQATGISHISFCYLIVVATPTPTPTPEPTATPTPTPEPTATPTPTPEPTATPTPTPDPTATPTPTPAPTATPTPTPDPTATPTPTPAPTGTPTPTPPAVAPTPTPPDTLTVPAGDGGPADRGAAFVMLLVGTLAAVWLLARPVRRPSRRRA